MSDIMFSFEFNEIRNCFLFHGCIRMLKVLWIIFHYFTEATKYVAELNTLTATISSKTHSILKLHFRKNSKIDLMTNSKRVIVYILTIRLQQGTSFTADFSLALSGCRQDCSVAESSRVGAQIELSSAARFPLGTHKHTHTQDRGVTASHKHTYSCMAEEAKREMK